MVLFLLLCVSYTHLMPFFEFVWWKKGGGGGAQSDRHQTGGVWEKRWWAIDLSSFLVGKTTTIHSLLLRPPDGASVTFRQFWRFNSLDDLAELRFGQNQRDFWTFADLCEVLALLLPYQMATKMLTNHFSTFNLNFTIKLQSWMAGNVGSCGNRATINFQILLN